MNDSTRVATGELKAHLSEHLRAVRAGATITVLDRRTPIALLVPVPVTGPVLSVERSKGDPHEVVLRPPLTIDADVDALLRAERGERL